MYILLALVAACAIGIGVHYAIPGRDLRGAALTPGIATATSAVVYTGLQWMGVEEGNGWLWLAAIPGAVLIAALLTIAIVAARRRSDAAARAAQGI